MLDGRTALHIAAIAGNVKIVEYLCVRGADVSRRDGEGKTPDDWAEEAGEMEIADLIKRYRKEKIRPKALHNSKFERFEQERGPHGTKKFNTSLPNPEGTTSLVNV